MICQALTLFLQEIREQAAATRAYVNVFGNDECDNIFLKRSGDAIWRELLSEIARVFDRSKTRNDENCTFLRLKEVCLKEQYLSLFPNGEQDDLIQALDSICEHYKTLPIKTARNKQLSHHDMNQLFDGDEIKISLDKLENFIEDTTKVFEKIYTRFYFGWIEVSFPQYDILVAKFESALLKLANDKTHSLS